MELVFEATLATNNAIAEAESKGEDTSIDRYSLEDLKLRDEALVEFANQLQQEEEERAIQRARPDVFETLLREQSEEKRMAEELARRTRTTTRRGSREATELQEAAAKRVAEEELATQVFSGSEKETEEEEEEETDEQKWERERQEMINETEQSFD